MRTKLLPLLLALGILLSAGVIQAAGPQAPSFQSPMPPRDAIPPTPPRTTPFWSDAVRITNYRVDVTIEDQVATTYLEQTFFNEANVPVEGTYLFPLPEDAAISDFNMIVDGQRVEGKIMRQEEARAVYESIVRQQRDPALLEYVGRDLFQARLFPIPPGGERKIELTYSQVLPLDNGLIHYRYPLRTQHLSRWPVQQLAIGVDLATASPLKAIYSPSHAVSVSRDGDYKALVGYEEANVIPDTDFDLYFSVDEAEIGVSLLSYKPAEEDGFFLLLAAPNVEVDESQVVARDILLVLDTSGSMEGAKIAQARQALLYVLNRLNPEDRFNVISFSTGLHQFDRSLQPVSRVEDARAFVERLSAVGGTDINRALLEALAQVDPERPAVIIFLTDGLPTQGDTVPERIMDNVRQAAGPNVQVFTFGVGDDVNTLLLDSIAQENRGASAYVRPNQGIDEIVSAFFAKVSTPVLSNLALNFGDVLAEDLYPYPLPDLFAGSQLVLAGRYRAGGSTDVTLAGLVNGQPRQFVFNDLTLREEGGEPFIARLWATRKIGHLLNEIRLRGRNQELVDEVVSLSTRYGIITPFTSFFVPEPPGAAAPAQEGMWRQSTATPPGTPAAAQPLIVRETVVVEKVVEVEREVAAAAEPAMEEMAEAPASGADAVTQSLAREAMRSADTVASGEGAGLRRAGDKSFAYQAGLWVDTAFKTTMPRQELAFGSEEYFALLGEHPEWAAYFSVSPNMIVALNGTAYIVTDTGEPIAVPVDTPRSEVPVADQQPAATSGVTPQAQPEVAERPAVESGPAAAQQAPLCGSSALAIGMIAGPGLWAWRRRASRSRSARTR